MHLKKISKVKGLFRRIHISPGRVPRARRYGSRALFLGRNLRDPRRNSTSAKQLHKSSRYSSLCIPLTCAVALLLGMILPDQTFAASECPWVTTPEGYTCVEDWEENWYHFEPNLTTPTSNTVSLTPSLSLTIDDNVVGDSNSGNTNVGIGDKVIAEYDKPNYSAHTVSLSASNIASYSLVLSNVGISTPTGAKMTGADNTAGSSLSADTWGYGWDDTNVENDNISYVSSTTKDLSNGVSVDSNNAVDITKKLVFVTKFGEDSVAGNYKVTATLSAIAMPAEVTKTFVKWDDLVYMQDMSTDTCTYAPIGVEKTLTDIRDNSTYTIAKLSDGKCWMTQNLRITGDSMKEGLNKTITGYDSDVDGNYIVPTSALWTDQSYDTSHAYYNNDTAYGAYYNWYTATAGTGTEEVVSGEASGSICPKGWRLPTNTGDYQALYNIYPNSSSSELWVPVADSPNGKAGRWFGAANTAGGGTFFPAAGWVHTPNGTNVSSTNVTAHYWTSNAHNTHARNFYFRNDLVVVSNIDYKYNGCTVRCVTK